MGAKQAISLKSFPTLCEHSNSPLPKSKYSSSKDLNTAQQAQQCKTIMNQEKQAKCKKNIPEKRKLKPPIRKHSIPVAPHFKTPAQIPSVHPDSYYESDNELEKVPSNDLYPNTEKEQGNYPRFVKLPSPIKNDTDSMNPFVVRNLEQVGTSSGEWVPNIPFMKELIEAENNIDSQAKQQFFKYNAKKNSILSHSEGPEGKKNDEEKCQKCKNRVMSAENAKTQCGHRFHVECIVDLRNCPVCGEKVEIDFDWKN